MLMPEKNQSSWEQRKRQETVSEMVRAAEIDGNDEATVAAMKPRVIHFLDLLEGELVSQGET